MTYDLSLNKELGSKRITTLVNENTTKIFPLWPIENKQQKHMDNKSEILFSYMYKPMKMLH